MSKLRQVLEGKSMSGEEIAQVLNTSRQNVSNTLKRAMGKYYDGVHSMFPSLSPYQIAMEMISMLQVDEEDVTNFYNLFPPTYREMIKKDAAKFLNAPKKARKKVKVDDDEIDDF